MEYILTTLITAAVFVVLILLLASKPKTAKIFTLVAFGLGGICGLLIYGYGYSVVTDDPLLAILKAVLAVCGSFVGNNEYDAIAAAPFMQTRWMQLLCTFIQICSLYATASAVISSIGTEALKRLRLWIGRREHLALIYGVNEDSLELGKELMEKKDGVVVYIASKPDGAATAAVSDLGCVLQSDQSATLGDAAFLRRFGLGNGKREMTLYALDKDSGENIRYATRLLASSKALDIQPERTHLVLMGQEEVAVSRLQKTPEKYGYGFVTVVNESQMAARLLTTKYPPCNAISFDEDGKATDDLEALLVGFGQVGQAVLKALVMNGRFEGSQLRLHVFAQDIHSIDGNFSSTYRGLLKGYDIRFYDDDARSRHMYEHLKDRAQELRYIVIATGDAEKNHEIAEEMIAYLNSLHREIPIFGCTRRGVAAYAPDGTVESTQNIYNLDLLCSQALDDRAMILNHRYQSNTQKTALEHWMECDYFSRQSCRAAADFIPAFLRAAGRDEQQVIDGDWNLSNTQLENLSRTEHLRWCAFHHCMGFSTMDDAEYAARAELYRQQKERDGKATIRVGKNMVDRTHACLIPWEALDALSAKESSITGKAVDHKASDTENVLAVPELLQAAKA